eukprot:765408-Hanusia_phi.AAC.2
MRAPGRRAGAVPARELSQPGLPPPRRVSGLCQWARRSAAAAGAALKLRHARRRTGRGGRTVRPGPYGPVPRGRGGGGGI